MSLLENSKVWNLVKVGKYVCTKYLAHAIFNI